MNTATYGARRNTSPTTHADKAVVAVRWRQRLREKVASGDRSPETVTLATFAGVYTPPLSSDGLRGLV